MTDEEIWEVARSISPAIVWDDEHYLAFANRIAALEREACAKVCDVFAEDRRNAYKGRLPYEVMNTHRADPYADGQSDGAAECSVQIRSRK